MSLECTVLLRDTIAAKSTVLGSGSGNDDTSSESDCLQAQCIKALAQQVEDRAEALVNLSDAMASKRPSFGSNRLNCLLFSMSCPNHIRLKRDSLCPRWRNQKRLYRSHRNHDHSEPAHATAGHRYSIVDRYLNGDDRDGCDHLRDHQQCDGERDATCHQYEYASDCRHAMNVQTIHSSEQTNCPQRGSAAAVTREVGSYPR